MDGRVLTILKYTPGSGSLPDPSLIKGACMGQAPPLCPLLPAAPLSFSVRPRKEHSRSKHARVICYAQLITITCQVLSTYVRCSHLNFTLNSGWL